MAGSIFPNTEIRVFLSSTFSDMHEERNYITKKIFPKVSRECEKRGIRFIVLDLRWGITEEESRNGKVLEICIDEINRTRPYFIGIVGGRYGWIPTKDEAFRNKHLVEKYPWISNYLNRRCSITEIEMQYGVLENLSEVDACFFLKDISKIKKTFLDNEGSEERYKLDALRKRILDRSEEGICTSDSYSNVEELGRKLHDRLMSIIDTRFPVDEKIGEHELFIRRQNLQLGKLRRFYTDCSGRHAFFEEIWRDIIIVTGEKGIGKSALLANWCPDDLYVDDDGNTTRIIRTVIDDSIGSLSKLTETFLYLALKFPETGISGQPFSTGQNEELSPSDIAKYFDNSSTAKKVIWIIDGLERISVSSVFDYTALFTLPSCIRTIISVDDTLYGKIEEYVVSKSGKYSVPGLNENEKLAILRKVLKDCGKSLGRKQEMHIITSELMSNPSELRLLIDELIQFGIYEELDNFIEKLVSAKDRKEFVSRILDIIEGDFDSGTAAKVLGLLSCLEYGIGENVLSTGLGFTPLRWSAIYSAVEPFLTRCDGRISIKDEFLRKEVYGRYVAGARRRSIENYAIELLGKEWKVCMKKLSFIHSLIFRLVHIGFDNSAFIRLSQIAYEQANLYIARNDWNHANDIVRKFHYQFMISFNNIKVITIIYDCIDNGLNPVKMLGLPLLKLFSLVDPDGLYISSFFMLLKNKSDDILRRLDRHLARMPFLGSYRKVLRRRISMILDSGGDTGINYEDTWKEGEEAEDLVKFAGFYNEVEQLLSEKRLDHIIERAEAVISSIPEDCLTSLLMQVILVLALLRRGKLSEAYKKYERLLSVSGVDWNIFIRIKFEISFSKGDFQECERIIEELGTSAGNDALYGKNLERLLINYSASILKDGHDIGYFIDKSLELDRDERTEQSHDVLLYLANTLYARECHFSAAEAYMKLSELTADDNMKSCFLFNAVDCLMKAKRYDEAAEIYAAIGARYARYGDKHIEYHHMMSMAVYCHSMLDEHDKAMGIITEAYDNLMSVRNDLPKETSDACFNYIICSCSYIAKELASVGGVLDISRSAFHEISEGNDNIPGAYASNYLSLLNILADRKDISREEMSVSLDVFLPRLYGLSLSYYEYSYLFNVLCIAGNMEFAGLLVEMAEKNDIRLSILPNELNPSMIALMSGNMDSLPDFVEMLWKIIRDMPKSCDFTSEIMILRKYGVLKYVIEFCKENPTSGNLLLLWHIAKIFMDNGNIGGDEENPDFITIPDLYSILLENGSDINAGTALILKIAAGSLYYSEEIFGSFLEFMKDKCGEIEYLFLSLADGLTDYCLTEKYGSFMKTDLIQIMVSFYINEGPRMTLSGREKFLQRIKGILDELTTLNADSENELACGVWPQDFCFELYKAFGIVPENIPVRLLLKFYALGLKAPDKHFFDILADGKAQGFVPDTETAALITGVYLKGGMLDEAEDAMEDFRRTLSENEDYEAFLNICRGIICSGRGKYTEAVSEFQKVDTEDEIDSYDLSLQLLEGNGISGLQLYQYFLVAVCCFYSDDYETGYWYADQIGYLYSPVEDILDVLALLKQNLSDDADRLFESKFSEALEETLSIPESVPVIEDNIILTAGLVLVHTEKARINFENSDFQGYENEIETAEKLISLIKDTPIPICIHELKKATSMRRNSSDGNLV